MGCREAAACPQEGDHGFERQVRENQKRKVSIVWHLPFFNLSKSPSIVPNNVTSLSVVQTVGLWLSRCQGWKQSSLKTEQKTPHPCTEAANFTPELFYWLTIPRVCNLSYRLAAQGKLTPWSLCCTLKWFFDVFLIFGIFIFWCKTDVLEIKYCLHFCQHRNSHLMWAEANPCWVPSSVNISQQTTVGVSCFISSDMVICQTCFFLSHMVELITGLEIVPWGIHQ